MTNFLSAFNFVAAVICIISAVMNFGAGAVGIGAMMASLALLNILLGIANLRR